MFKTELKMDEEGMTVPYPRLFDPIRSNHGYVDVRGRPELAAEIAETSNSSAMKTLLIRLAQPGAKIFTIGCDLGTEFQKEDARPHVAGGYIQIMNATYAKCSPEDYARYAAGVAEKLREASRGNDWQVHFVLKPVAFKLDGFSDMTGSLWIWFHAYANTAKRALSSRETLISELGRALTSERHISLFDRAHDKAV
jgi:hypothetical protein